MKKIAIQKSTGDITGFNEEKLKHSLRQSGAKDDVMETVLKEIRTQLYQGMPTRKIYKLALHRLKQLQPLSAAKYKLKKGIMELGPAGFIFEKNLDERLEEKIKEIRSSGPSKVPGLDNE